MTDTMRRRILAMGLSMQQDLQVRSLRATLANTKTLSHRQTSQRKIFRKVVLSTRATSGIGEGTAYALHGRSQGVLLWTT